MSQLSIFLIWIQLSQRFAEIIDHQKPLLGDQAFCIYILHNYLALVLVIV